MRDIEKRAEEGRNIIRKHRRMDLSLTEIKAFYDLMREKNDLADVIEKAFDFGVSVGARCVK